MKYYSKSHEWIEVDGDDEGRIGITEYAAKELGDITFVELPPEEADLIVGDPLGVVESVKAASDVYSPVSGTIVAVNDALEEDPGLINSSAEGEGWICQVDNIDAGEIEELMDEEQYQKMLAEQS